MTSLLSQLAGPIIGAILTLLVLSYLIGDNPLYRLALHIFVGVLIGTSLAIAIREVLLGMALPGLLSNPLSVVVPLVLGILLLFKGFPEQAYIGNFSVAYLIGVGTAVALGGALLGTLAPQVRATEEALSPTSLSALRFGLLDGLMIVVGTVCTLVTFTFVGRDRQTEGFTWRSIVQGAAWVGRLFLIVAFGVAFAGALTASLSIFVGRTEQLIDLALRALGL
jgi:hypothetical protein